MCVNDNPNFPRCDKLKFPPIPIDVLDWRYGRSELPPVVGQKSGVLKARGRRWKEMPSGPRDLWSSRCRLMAWQRHLFVGE